MTNYTAGTVPAQNDGHDPGPPTYEALSQAGLPGTASTTGARATFGAGDPARPAIGVRASNALPAHGSPGTVPGVFDLDEELARPTEVGAIIHRVTAALAATTCQPSLALLKGCIDGELARFAPIEARAHRQNITAAAWAYFRQCLPPEGWAFAGSEHDLGTGRADLVWLNPVGRVLVDELKTWAPRNLRLRSTAQQVEKYRKAAIEAWGDAFVGLRLICPTEVAASFFVQPDGTYSDLASSGFLGRPSRA